MDGNALACRFLSHSSQRNRTNHTGDTLNHTFPKTKARQGWEINPQKFQEACDILGLKLPIKIRYSSGWRTGATHRGRDGHHAITLSQIYSADTANSFLWHELIHAKQAEEWHFKTGESMLHWHQRDYRAKNGPWGVKYWRNAYEVEAREKGDAYSEERMILSMPDNYGFDHLTNWGAKTVQCIEQGCYEGGSLTVWTEEKRSEHFKMHHPYVAEKQKRSRRTKAEIEKDELERRKKIEAGEIAPPISWYINEFGMRVQNCRTCGEPFEQERKRGKPRVWCSNCKEWDN